ncbi:regulatory protein GemA [Desulfocurvibacter africanus]|uniref:regulatory protein GemA n=1 Tax=Desulfocurvibacter africanus TaxID=873 RepID=UPI002FDAE309
MTNHTTRKGLLAKIHIAKKDLALSDPEYRVMLSELFGVDSSSRLTVPQLSQLLNHFVSRGWTGPAQPAGLKKTAKASDHARIFVSIPDSDPNARQKRRILAQVRALGWSLDHLNERCQRQFGVAQFAWLKDQAHLQTLGKDIHNRCNKRGIDPDNAEAV